MKYNDESTITRCENYKGGKNNLVILSTNPVGTDPCSFSAETVTTTSAVSVSNAVRRHRSKLRKLNKSAHLAECLDRLNRKED